MIKANYVRVNNYLSYKENIITVVPKTIDDIGFQQSLNSEFYTGIPITEEWLLRLGFVLSYESEFRRKFDLDSDTKFGYDYDLNGNVNGMQGFRHYGRYYKCEDVNTLQNLYFFLSNGKELTL